LSVRGFLTAFIEVVKKPNKKENIITQY